MTNFFLPLLGLVGIASAFVPTNVVPRPLSMESGTRLRMFNFGGSGGGASVPKNASDRDNKAIAAIRSTIASPRTPGFPLIEVEFPPLEALNKLGDGSLRSANQAEEANLAFALRARPDPMDTWQGRTRIASVIRNRAVPFKWTQNT